MKVQVKLFQYNVRASDGSFHKLRKRAFSDTELETADEKALAYKKNLEVEEGKEFKYDLVWSGNVDINMSDKKADTTPSIQDESMFENDGVSSLDFIEEESIDRYPRGWHRRNEFIAKDGTVYHRGIEVPELYRKKEPSDY